eukprot:gene37271-50306_t
MASHQHKHYEPQGADLARAALALPAVEPAAFPVTIRVDAAKPGAEPEGIRNVGGLRGGGGEEGGGGCELGAGGGGAGPEGGGR